MRAPVLTLAAMVVLLSSGCKVRSGFVDTDLFPCSVASDCGEGWGCVRASPYASDFCAPICDETCDGICTEQEGASLCLRGCRISDEGVPSECLGEGFACIRTSTETNAGICYPVDGCSIQGDCEADHVCLSGFAAGVPEAPPIDNSFCVPSPGRVPCPARSTPVSLGGEFALCLATCEPPDTRCPPSFGCLEQFGLFSAGREVPCFPGVYGTPCDDDTNCLFGRCLDTGGAGKQCTTTCDDAQLQAFGCANLLNLGIVSPVFELECDPSANGGADGGLCVTRYGVGFPCTPDRPAFTCLDGLECRPFPTGGGATVDLCSKNCVVDEGCNDPGEPAINYCLRGFPPGGSSCLPKGSAGDGCSTPNHCLSGVCVDGSCLGDGS